MECNTIDYTQICRLFCGDNMKFQTIYKTDADYYETWEKARKSQFVSMVDCSSKGHLCFKLRDSKHVAELTRDGKLIIVWESEEEKKKLFSLLKQVLATKDGRPADIRPLSTTIYNIPYPPPMNFQISYCSDWIYYFGISSCEWYAVALALGLLPIATVLGVIITAEISKNSSQ